MGWTRIHSDKRTRKGDIDRKATINSEHDMFYDIHNSRMVGSVYYGVWSNKENNGASKFAVVILTSTDKTDYFNFGYKSMTESEHPYYYDFPITWLDMLTETDDKLSLDWRNKVRKNHENKSKLNRLVKQAKAGKRIKGTIKPDVRKPERGGDVEFWTYIKGCGQYCWLNTNHNLRWTLKNMLYHYDLEIVD